MYYYTHGALHGKPELSWKLWEFVCIRVRERSEREMVEFIHCKFVHLLFYLYYSIVYFSIVYYSIAMQPLAQEFPSGLIEFYLILSYLRYKVGYFHLEFCILYFLTCGLCG